MYESIVLVLLIVCDLVSDSYQEPTCNVNGTVYRQGQRTPDPCNRCWCSKGLDVCERKACDAAGNKSCFLGGKEYLHMKRTNDPCGRCYCYDGGNYCTKKPCNQ